jgi:hypothetical protein
MWRNWATLFGGVLTAVCHDGREEQARDRIMSFEFHVDRGRGCATARFAHSHRPEQSEWRLCVDHPSLADSGAGQNFSSLGSGMECLEWR